MLDELSRSSRWWKTGDTSHQSKARVQRAEQELRRALALSRRGRSPEAKGSDSKSSRCTLLLMVPRLVEFAGGEVEAFSRRERSGSLLPKS
jgi:hypothetical protein